MSGSVGRVKVPRLVCVLGIGRMGSNHLRRILSCVPEIDSRAELFNPRQSYTLRPDELRELSRRSGRRFKPSNRHPKALRTIQRHPGLVLACLSDLRAPEKRIVSFKVLTGQLTTKQISREIIGRPDTVIVFIRRRPVDAFISQMKASHHQKWRDVDTTETKIDIDAGDFLAWRQARATWYRRLEAACWRRDKPYHQLTYEDDIDRPPSETVRRFCAILSSYGLGDFAIPDDAQIEGLARQDRNHDIGDRVDNWSEFLGRLEAMGCLDKAFTPFSNFQPNTWDWFQRWLFGLPRTLGRLLSSRSTHVPHGAMPEEHTMALKPGRRSQSLEMD